MDAATTDAVSLVTPLLRFIRPQVCSSSSLPRTCRPSLSALPIAHTLLFFLHSTSHLRLFTAVVVVRSITRSDLIRRRAAHMLFPCPCAPIRLVWVCSSCIPRNCRIVNLQPRAPANFRSPSPAQLQAVSLRNSSSSSLSLLGGAQLTSAKNIVHRAIVEHHPHTRVKQNSSNEHNDQQLQIGSKQRKTR